MTSSLTGMASPEENINLKNNNDEIEMILSEIMELKKKIEKK